MGIAGLSTAQDDILEALGAAHQVHVCGFRDSEIERPAPTRRRAEGPCRTIWRATRSLARLVAAIFELRNFPTFAAPCAVALTRAIVGPIKEVDAALNRRPSKRCAVVLGQPGLLLRGHANAGVGHGKLDPGTTVGDPARPQGDLTLLGELKGIAPDRCVVGAASLRVRTAG